MSKKIEISRSSLVSLKAELARKQEEVNRAKSDAKNSFAHLPPQPKKQTVFTRKNAGVDSRNSRDCEEIRKDEEDLKKSRAALEAKSKLYDKLSQQPSSSETEDRQFLVDFEQKSREDQRCVSTADPEEEEVDDEEDSNDDTLDPNFDWVEYADCLGRTKMCLRQDLAFVKEKDAKLAESLGLAPEPEPEPDRAAEKQEEPAAQPELVSAAAVKREQMRQKWEEQELRLRDKMDTHYQDVLFDEARAHGVGYYGFSSDEAERRTQQEALGRLRQETTAKQQLAQEARQRRQQQMAARLKAARDRQRARLGLPPEEDEPETPAPEKEEEEEPSAPEMVQSEEISQKTADLPKKVPQVRPWDIGKEGVAEHQVLSQEEWVKKRRDDRLQEFAPPVTYVEDTAPSGRPQKAPRKWTSHKLFQKKQPEHSPDAGEEDEPAPPPAYLEDMALLGPEPTMFFTTKRQKVAVDVSAPSGSAAQHEEQAAARTGVEIAPPPTYEYYGPSGSTLRKDMDKKDMESAIVAGLKYLRKHAEDKEAQREKGLLPIL